MPTIPRESVPDSTLDFLKEGYQFISKHCEKHQSDIFETRLLLKQFICMRGQEAAEIFYNSEYFQRKGAVPERVLKTLTGKGGIQGLDGRQHQRRKALFMSLMSPANLTAIKQLAQQQWQERLWDWQNMQKINLFDECNILFCRIACDWAGIPLPDSRVEEVAKQMNAMIESPAAIGPLYWKGKLARKRAEAWLTQIIEDIRSGALLVSASSAAYSFAHFRDGDNTILDAKVAAVDLLNVIRPIVAISRYVVFSALALHKYPEYRSMAERRDESELTLFVQEVRRYYPFFPAVAAIVRKNFLWKGYLFRKGTHVLLDLYGTNHDPKIWRNPEQFHPPRFRNWAGSPFDFIPQGGGSHNSHHRCAGEWITVELMKVALGILTRNITYTVPSQDLQVSLSSIPSKPASGFIMDNIVLKSSLPDNFVNKKYYFNDAKNERV